MNTIESICIRYVGENSTTECSDVELTELQDTMDTSWITLRNIIISLCDSGTFRKLSKKGKILTLTVKGWGQYRKLTGVSKVDVVEDQPEAIEEEPNLSRINVIVDGVYHLISDCRVPMMNACDSITFAGNDKCKLTESQVNQYRRWKHKITNWDTFPRK